MYCIHGPLRPTSSGKGCVAKILTYLIENMNEIFAKKRRETEKWGGGERIGMKI